MEGASLWGNVPGWLEGVGTVGAFSVALFLLLRERGERQARLAHKVTTWIEAKGAETEPHLVYVRNSGETPVYNCHAYARWPHLENREDLRFGTVPPGATLLLRANVDPYAGAGIRMAMDPEFGPTVEVAFTDAEGRHWRRNADGSLSRLKLAPKSEPGKTGEIPPEPERIA